MPRTTMRMLLLGAIATCFVSGATSLIHAQETVDSAIPSQLETLPVPHGGTGSGYAAGGSVAGSYAPAGGYPDLFYNYYAAPGSTSAAMYPAPRPTPALVGHTYYTYQPWLPHEYLYTHHRVYMTYYGNFHGGCGQYKGCPSINKTTISYGRGCIRPAYCYRYR